MCSEALYTNIQRFSIHDGGGIRTVVFLKGCPFRCPWCCNPENLSFAPETVWHAQLCIHCSMAPDEKGAASCPQTPEACPTGAKERMGKPADVDELVDLVLRDRIFYEESGGGVTLSGGECLTGPNQRFALAFLASCRKAGLSTAVETTLATPLEDPEALVRACDSFLVDFKIADREASLETIGLDTALRDGNLKRILALGASVTARLPIIPGYTDGEENVEANLRTIQELGIHRADILPFHQLGESKYDALGKSYGLRGAPQLADEAVSGIVERFRQAGIATTIHGT